MDEDRGGFENVLAHEAIARQVPSMVAGIGGVVIIVIEVTRQNRESGKRSALCGVSVRKVVLERPRALHNDGLDLPPEEREVSLLDDVLQTGEQGMVKRESRKGKA